MENLEQPTSENLKKAQYFNDFKENNDKNMQESDFLEKNLKDKFSNFKNGQENCEKIENSFKNNENIEQNQIIFEDGSKDGESFSKGENGDKSSAYISEDESFGKFKDAGELLKAYQNLEAKFTTKCQELAKFKNENKQKDEDLLYDKFEKFARYNSEAQDLKDELISLAKKDEYKNLENPFEKAYEDLLFSRSASLLNSKTNKIKEQIITEYLNEVVKNSPPRTLSSSVGTRASTVQNENFGSLSDAKNYLTKLFGEN